MIKPASKRTLCEDIIRQMLEMIKTESWAPNTRLPGEFVLAKTFEVSRNSLREALKALELSGNIEARAGKGTVVATDAPSIVRSMELLWICASSTIVDNLVPPREFESLSPP